MYFIFIFVLALILIFFLKKYAWNVGLIDIPNERSSHQEHTPRGAGIGFFLAAALITPCFHFDLCLSHIWTLFSIFLVFIVGVIDDYHDTSPKIKFVIIAISAVLLSFDGIVISNIGTFFGLSISLGWFALPFTVFVVVGYTNGLNLIDGIDGLSASLSIVIMATFYAIGYHYDDLFMCILSSAFIAGLLAFLCFNWYPATIFMGDSGSLTLGLVISILAISALNYIPSAHILFIVAIPIIDTIIVMIRRKRNGKSMFSADRCHIHHIIKKLFGENTPRTVTFLILLQAIYSFMGLQLDQTLDEGYFLLFFILNIAMLYLLLGALIKKHSSVCSQRKQNTEV